MDPPERVRPSDEEPARPDDGRPPPPISARQINEHRGLALEVLAVATVVGMVLALMAAYDFGPLAGTAIATVLGYLGSALVHFLLGAMIVGGIMDLPHPSGLLSVAGRVAMTVVTVALAVAIGFVDVHVLQVASAGDRAAAYAVVGALSLLAGGLLSYLVLSAKHLQNENHERVAIWGVAALGGLAVGTIVVVATIIGLGLIRYERLPTADITVPRIHGLSGEYVALGDSYSAGEGLRPFDPHTSSLNDDGGDDCHRSSAAYSQWLTFDGTQPAVRFAACSGAVSPDVYTGYDKRRADGSEVPVPPQVPPGVHPEVGLVTMTMGGNDALFSKIVVHCLEHAHCMAAEFQPPDTPPDQTPPVASGGSGASDVNQVAAASAAKITFPPAQPLSSWGPAAIDAISARMAVLYGRLAHDYPNARIVIIGYPQLFPAGQATFFPTDCATLLRRFSSEERDALRQLTTAFNNMLYEEATKAGIEFVSPAAAWDGHEPCGDKGQYTNSVKLIVAPNIVDGGSFHPNRDGQKALAALVACYLDTHPGKPNPYVDGSPHEVTVEGLKAPAELGLVDAPGSVEAPLACDGVQ